MNYRHAFHAGNFADVLKHAVLARILLQLGRKPAAFRVIDLHAGAGLYDLAGPEAARSPEWRQGIARLFETSPAPPAAALLAPYLDAVRAVNGAGALARYPGSPILARHFLRSQDRLLACELEPEASRALMRNCAGDRRLKVVSIDGWTGLKAFVPPPERRGVVLIDPPFEQPGDFDRIATGIEVGHRRWSGGCYLAWYPLKDRAGAEGLGRRLRRSGIPKILRAELDLGSTIEPGRLQACGLILVNPPWGLADELTVLLPELARLLSPQGAGHRMDWLAPEPPGKRS